jgi:hypothetical protein
MKDTPLLSVGTGKYLGKVLVRANRMIIVHPSSAPHHEEMGRINFLQAFTSTSRSTCICKDATVLCGESFLLHERMMGAHFTGVCGRCVGWVMGRNTIN